jgi:BirA family biotin operon repressor/biotin-[acetyl-CoA-carboxylase] ligase
MERSRALASDGAPRGTLVLAEEQLQGRGRLGRRWVSPAGVNLYFSVVLRPTADRLPALAMILPLAVVDGIRAASDLECALKWPNDVQVGGRKLAGVLIETELTGQEPQLAIAGAGINVNYDPSSDPEIAATATSVTREIGRPQERELLLAECMNALERWHEAPIADVKAAWRSCLTTLGQRVRVTYGDVVDDGIAEDVADDGSLVLLRDDGSRLTLPAGDVSLRQQT